MPRVRSLKTVPPEHHAIEAARKEALSSLVAKYQREIGKHALRLSRPENRLEVVRLDLASAVNPKPFRGTSYAEGLTDDDIRRRVSREVIRVLRRIRL